MSMLPVLRTQAHAFLKLAEALCRASAPAQTTDQNAATEAGPGPTPNQTHAGNCLGAEGTKHSNVYQGAL